MIKSLAKKIILKPLLPFARKIHAKLTYQDKPHLTRFPDNSYPVLQCCIAYNKYGGYCVPLSSHHRPAAQKILSGAIYEPETIEFLMSHCNDGDIVHAGTYFGDFLPALSRSCAHGTKIWAYEPNSENYQCALITSYINGLQNVELTHAGLGERPASLAMVTADSRGKVLGGASYMTTSYMPTRKNVLGSTEEMVQIIAIDEMVPSSRKVSIIQLDVEGYEKQALSGALKTIQRCLPIIIVETLPEDTWLSKNILPLGYQISQKVHQNTVLTYVGNKN